MGEEPDPTQAAFIVGNRELWDAWTKIHAGSDFYNLDGFRQGGVRLRDYETAEIGPVAGKDVLHHQCHFGIDTLSWARLGARVTGLDFSAEAIGLARRLAGELGLEARFIESDVYELPAKLDERFDVVYMSRGVLGWLPDIRRWAQVVGRFVKPGGIFYLHEIHPVLEAFEYAETQPGDLQLAYPYWEHARPLSFPVKGSYADPEADLGKDLTEYGWNHGLGEIVTALAEAGLRIASLREYAFLEWPAALLVEVDGRWRLPGELDGRLPLMFSIKATCPPS